MAKAKQKSKSQEKREAVQSAKPGFRKVKLFYDYRNEAKRGEIYETDAPKAEELVRLGRAEYVDEEGGEQNMGPNDDNQNEQSQAENAGETQTPAEGESQEAGGGVESSNNESTGEGEGENSQPTGDNA